MKSYSEIVGLLPDFVSTFCHEEKFALWQAMEAAYNLGLVDAADEMEKGWQNCSKFLRSMASETTSVPS